MKNKVLLLIILVTLQLSAVSQKSVEFYVKKYIENKTHSPVQKVETISTYEIGGTNGWQVYFLSLKVNLKMGNVSRLKRVTQVAFAKGNKIAFSLKDKKGQEYSKILKPKVPHSAYDDAHLLAGDKNAAHKMLLISDPFCPFCQEIVPPLITAVQKNPTVFALYSYQLPLVRIHPASATVTKVMSILHEEGKVEDYKKMYHLLVSEKERNVNVILKAIQQKIGRKFTKKEISNPKIKQMLDFDLAMKRRLMVTGTPTIFIDDIWDPSRMAYKRYIKEAQRATLVPKEKEEEGFFSSLFN